MRNSILRFLLVGLSFPSMGQTINEMEYFFDNDPGYGMATSVTITPGSTINQLFNAPTGAIATGFHDLFIRVKETGGVLTISPIGGTFEVGESVTGGSSGATGTILAAFPDRLEISTTGTFTVAETLTGATSGATATLSTFTANWSVPESRLVYVDPTGAGTVLVEELEYFFDMDPGYDMGTKFTAFTAAAVVNEMQNVSTGSLSIGFHTLFVRAKAVGGVWGIPEPRLVFVDDTGTGVILVEELEYFFDMDPGYGMGTKFTTFTASNVVNHLENVPTGSLSTGFHTLFIRAKSVGNTWGVPESRLVYVDPTGAGMVQVEEIEYFFDSDPGYGMGTKFSAFTAGQVVNELENVATGSLSTGFHTLFVRAKSVGDTWGLPEVRLVYVDPSGSVNADIVAIEYFFDMDPGVGMATAVTVNTPGFTVSEIFDIDALDVPLGVHTLGIRAQNADGVWGMLETKSITSEINNILDFDRDNNDHVTLSSSIMMADYTAGMTVEFWANATETAGGFDLDVFSINEPTNGDDILKMSYRADLNNYSLVSNGQTTLTSSGAIDDNEWHHFAISISSSGDVNLYQDGLQIGQTSGYPVPSATDLMFLGAEVNSPGGVVSAGYFRGQIEDFRIWNSELPASQIRDYLEYQDLTGHGSLSSLIVQYTFDQGTAGVDNSGETTLQDESGNSFDGTLSGGFDLIGSTSNWVASSVFTSSTLVPTTPSTQASEIQISAIEATEALIVINTNGDGGRRIIAVKQGNSGLPSPLDNTFYSADPVFGSGADIGGGWLTIFNGFGSVETVTGLSPSTEYIVAAIELNGAAGFEAYNSTSALSNPVTFTTSAAPDVTAPTVVTQNITVTLDASGNVSITPDQINNGSSDNTTIEANLILSIDIDAFDRTNLGDNTVTLTVTDEAGNSAFATATVTVLDNNSAPTLSYIFYLDENSDEGTLIGTVIATDPENDPLTYAILSGNSNDAFEVGSTDGDITVASQEALDFETTPTFSLMVQANDGNGGISMVSITINLNDIIDENPLGLDDKLDQISVYPNPAYESIFLELGAFSLGDFQVHLFTVSGSEVELSTRIRSKSINVLEIGLESLDAGMYLLKIESNETLVTKNILVRN
ncbi:MAG: LamG-like jellyroll fold domain-containing protein [Cyclobacteriaceae bacterium]